MSNENLAWKLMQEEYFARCEEKGTMIYKCLTCQNHHSIDNVAPVCAICYSNMKNKAEDAEKSMREAQGQIKQLLWSTGEHITVRGEYLARAEAAEARIKELEIVLDAWAQVFGSRQLSHASDNFNAMKARAEAAEARVKELELGVLEHVRVCVKGSERAKLSESREQALAAQVKAMREALSTAMKQYSKEPDYKNGWRSGMSDERYAELTAVLTITESAAERRVAAPIPMVMYCPDGHQHIDKDEWATKPHKTHQCQVIPGCRYPGCRNLHSHEMCGLEWRPSEHPTVGVAALGQEGASHG